MIFRKFHFRTSVVVHSNTNLGTTSISSTALLLFLPWAPRLCLLFMHVRFHGYQARNLCGIGRPGANRPSTDLSISHGVVRVRYEKVSNWFRLSSSCFRKSERARAAISPGLFRPGPGSTESSSSFFFIFVCGCCEA